MHYGVILQLHGTSRRELVDYDFPLVVLNTISIISFQVVVHAWRYCLNLNEVQPISVH